MGFSDIAAHAIWVSAIAVVVGATSTAAFRSLSDTWEGLDDRRVIVEERLAGRLAKAFTSYDPATETLTLHVRNAGGVALRASKVTLVLDGEVATSFTAAVLGTGGSDRWLPNETAEFTIGSQPGAPGRLVVVTERGLTNLTILPSGPLATIVVLPDARDVAAGSVADFDARGYDASWRRILPLAASWTTSAGTIASLDSDSGRLTAQTTATTGLAVTATSGAVSGSATVNVVAGPLDHVTVSPSAVTLAAGASQTFTSAGYDAYGNAISGLAFTWSATAGAITPGGAFTAPASEATVTVTATSGAASGTATATVVQFRYASETMTDVAGGSVANAAALTRDGGGDVATFTETRTSTSVTIPSASNDRDFETSPVAGWSISGAGMALSQTESEGWTSATGALKVRRTQGGEGTAFVEHSWTQGAYDAVDVPLLAFDYKFKNGLHASRYVEAWLVKPSGVAVQIGLRMPSTIGVWTPFAPTLLDSGDLGAAGTYTLRFVIGLRGNGDEAFVDNAWLTFTGHTPYRFGRELEVPSLPTGGGTYTLEIRYRVSSGAEGLVLSTEGPSGTWTSRATLASATFATFTRALTPDETSSGALRLRLVDETTAGDASAGAWDVDYVRIESLA